MSRIIGDRRENTLDEMEEVARERNKDVAEEERLEAIRKRKEEAERAKAPSMPHDHVITPVGNIIATDYNRVEFEPNVSRDIYNDKIAFTYDGSLERVKSAGYDRHASPEEAFTLFADNLEGKLQGEYKAAADDMLSSHGEWLSMAMERKGDVLVCYLHPEGLVWNEDKRLYIKKGFKYEDRQKFNVSGKVSQVWMPFDAFDNDFVKFIYGRNINDLPEKMREGTRKLRIDLPGEGILWPVCYGNTIVFSTGANQHYRASRGVKEKMMKPIYISNSKD